ncbi:MAG: cell division protein ZapA [Prevotella sp.]|nr:cell division protein ZapA [Prevotella sp.]
MAGEKKLLNIRLHVYDMVIPAKVEAENEPFYRNAAKLITDTVNSYSDAYKKTKSDKEILYMAMIDIALQFELLKQNKDTEPYDNILKKITTEIEEALDKK